MSIPDDSSPRSHTTPARLNGNSNGHTSTNGSSHHRSRRREEVRLSSSPSHINLGADPQILIIAAFPAYAVHTP